MREQKKPRRWAWLNILSKISKQDNSDIDGSYTGTAADGTEPTQDADDL